MLRGNNMNYDDLKNFYSKDKKEYDLYHNLEFLKWFNNILKNGYTSYLNLSALQSFINKLSMWYEYKYPERKFYEIDTKGITLGSYSICLSIGEMYKNGASIEEIQAWADREIDKTAFYFYADDLKFFGKSGRVSGFAAFFGNIIGLKPIIFIDTDGKMKTKDKCRGRKQALQTLLQYVIDLQEDIKAHRVVIAHTDALPIAEEFGNMMKDYFGQDLEIEYEVVNPTAGSHCGPNAMGVTFHAKHR